MNNSNLFKNLTKISRKPALYVNRNKMKIISDKAKRIKAFQKGGVRHGYSAEHDSQTPSVVVLLFFLKFTIILFLSTYILFIILQGSKITVGIASLIALGLVWVTHNGSFGPRFSYEDNEKGLFHPSLVFDM